MLDVLSVVKANELPALAGSKATDRRSDAVACAIVLKARLLVLVAGQRELVAPVALIPRRLDQAAALQRVAGR